MPWEEESAILDLNMKESSVGEKTLEVCEE